MSDKLRADYARRQIEKGLGHPIPQAGEEIYWDGAAGSGVGITDRAGSNPAYATSAADTDLVKASAELVRLMKVKKLSFDAAMKAVRESRQQKQRAEQF